MKQEVRTERVGRMKKVNELVRLIGDTGRRFFYNQQTKAYARMVMVNDRLYWIDHYMGERIYLHARRANWRGFSEGGTLRGVVEYFKEFVMTGKPMPSVFGPWPDWYCGGDPWGYGEGMRRVREKAVELGLIETELRERLKAWRGYAGDLYPEPESIAEIPAFVADWKFTWRMRLAAGEMDELVYIEGLGALEEVEKLHHEETLKTATNCAGPAAA